MALDNAQNLLYAQVMKKQTLSDTAVNKPSRRSDILIPCPSCGTKRWMRKETPEGPNFTGYCKRCVRHYLVNLHKEHPQQICLDEHGAINKQRCPSDILVTCPDCSTKRWVTMVRTKRLGFTGRCNKCCTRELSKKISRRVDYPTGAQNLGNGNYILWDTLCSKNDGILPHRCPKTTGSFVQVFCQGCNQTRWAYAALVYQQVQKGTFTGYCQKHFPRSGKDSPVWKGGTFVNANGYIIMSQSALSPEDAKLVESMMPHKYPYIMEHRLVMAKHLRRPLSTHEVVHHINGDRVDNRLENLQLTTTEKHTPGHGAPFYQFWQETLTEIESLKKQLADL